MKKTELIATLALPKMPRIGYTTARKLIRHFGNASAVYENIVHARESQFQAVANVFRGTEKHHKIANAEKEVALMEKHHINWIAYSDVDFPASLNQCGDAPLVLFYSGQSFQKNHTNSEHCWNKATEYTRQGFCVTIGGRTFAISAYCSFRVCLRY